LRRGWYSEEPKSEDLAYGGHVMNPVWKNGRKNTNWNDQISQKWLFSSYFKEAKDFINLRSFNKNKQDDPVIKFLSEVIPIIYGPKFNLTKVPKDPKTGLMLVPDLKTCVINFCKFHYIYDVSMLHIPSMPRLVLKHKAEEQMEDEDDVWKVMRKILVDPIPKQRVQEEEEEEEEEDSTYDLDNYEEEQVTNGSTLSNEEEEEENEQLKRRPAKKQRKWKEEEDPVPPHQTEEETYEQWVQRMSNQVDALNANDEAGDVEPEDGEDLE
jgi:hypothetical protein